MSACDDSYFKVSRKYIFTFYSGVLLRKPEKTCKIIALVGVGEDGSYGENNLQVLIMLKFLFRKYAVKWRL
jgi:hypothetical protein